MARYEITYANGYGRELERVQVTAPSMAVALTLSANLLHAGAVFNGEWAETATVAHLGVYGCKPEDVDESAGQRELHSVRAVLHEAAGLLDLEAAVFDPADRDEFGHGLGEVDGGAD